jgi:hypothetical protein
MYGEVMVTGEVDEQETAYPLRYAAVSDSEDDWEDATAAASSGMQCQLFLRNPELLKNVRFTLSGS